MRGIVIGISQWIEINVVHEDCVFFFFFFNAISSPALDNRFPVFLESWEFVCTYIFCARAYHDVVNMQGDARIEAEREIKKKKKIPGMRGDWNGGRDPMRSSAATLIIYIAAAHTVIRDIHPGNRRRRVATVPLRNRGNYNCTRRSHEWVT